ncbi:DUF374 domain-containing protein [Leptospira fluminis]|uniref:DUF374 domain-containing protein n=1 Tax=Leptospira fluminis TaxID=2484979 RepID=A0A4R9GTP6_9LEPT|nr:lysophospholipid acyltransferase family protein [Leptospira fluminis]TGK22376.1 DUF374 domain-containing protein [Leptospira fluminis]
MILRLSVWISILVLRLTYGTVRWTEIRIPDATRECFRKKSGLLLALWHNQIPFLIDFTSSYLVKRMGLRIVPLASRSKDGELIARVLHHFGIRSKRGSSRRGGASGLKALVGEAMHGGVSLITPDGPTGPVYELKAGIVQLASITGYPIIAYSAQYDRYWTTNSWDRIKVPKPFSRAVITCSEPFLVPKLKGAEQLEEWRRKLERFLLENCGVTEVEAEALRQEVLAAKKVNEEIMQAMR